MGLGSVLLLELAGEARVALHEQPRLSHHIGQEYTVAFTISLDSELDEEAAGGTDATHDISSHAVVVVLRQRASSNRASAAPRASPASAPISAWRQSAPRSPGTHSGSVCGVSSRFT